MFVGGILVGAAIHGPKPLVLAQPAATVEAPKWDLGDRWTYQRGKNEFTLTVVGTSGGYVVRQTGSNTGTFHYDSDLSSKDVHFGQFQFPLKVGKEWTNPLEGIALNGQPAKWNTKRKVEGMESVTVPAGTFDAVRMSARECNLTYGDCGDYVIWYAPKAKQVAKITWTNANYWPGFVKGLNQVLVSYEVHSP